MKVNLNQIKVLDIEGNAQYLSVSRDMGNAMYMRGENIEECELGKRIYADGKDGKETELSEAEVEIVKKYTEGYSYIVRQAIVEGIS